MVAGWYSVLVAAGETQHEVMYCERWPATSAATVYYCALREGTCFT